MNENFDKVLIIWAVIAVVILGSTCRIIYKANNPSREVRRNLELITMQQA